MGYIFYLMGKSASGKDSLFRLLLEDPQLDLRTVVMYTTRPARSGEKDGREYFFRDEAFFHEMEKAGRVIEARVYETVCGPWRYFTLDDGQIDLDEADYLMIGTLESYEKTKRFFEEKGREALIPLYICAEDGERLERAVKRERGQQRPNYEEVCRRFLADARDFSEERLRACGISRVFENRALSDCERELKAAIMEKLL